MSTDAEKVRAAADHIEKHGLTKGRLYDLPGGVPWGRAEAARETGAACCTIGALEAYEANTEEVRDDLAAFLGVSSGNGWDEIPDWNDAPERTADEVVGVLRSFADTLDAQPE